MKLARIVRNWSGIDLLRQTPGERGIWEDVRFTMECVDKCDYLIISNSVPRKIEVNCPPEHVWSIIAEPPERFFKRWHTDLANVYRVYTVDPEFSGERYVHGQTALPWHVDRNYDELLSCPCPPKTRTLSWATSNIAVFSGHRARMRFMDSIRGQLDYDLFGRGFEPVENKWDALAPYRYSFAIENHRNPYYWTEKIADCFLAWTMPIYWGCTRITDYFPAESMIVIDIHDPDVVARIKSEIAADRWRRSLDAIAHARELVLNRYQLFPFVVDEIHRMEASRSSPGPARRIVLCDKGGQRREQDSAAAGRPVHTPAAPGPKAL